MKPKKNKINFSFLPYSIIFDEDVCRKEDLVSLNGLFLFDELTSSSSSDEKASAVYKASEQLVEDNVDIQEVILLCFDALLQSDMNNVLSHSLIKCLTSMTEKYQNSYYERMKNVLKVLLSSNMNSHKLLNALEILVKRRNLALLNLSDFSFSDIQRKELVEDLYWRIFDITTNHIETLSTEAFGLLASSSEVNALFQTMNKIIEKFSAFIKACPEFFQCGGSVTQKKRLLKLLFEIASHDSTNLNLRITSGLLIVQLSLDVENDVKSILEEVLLAKGLFDSAKDITQLAIFHGVLCLADGKQLLTPTREKSNSDEHDLFTKLLNRIFCIVYNAQVGSVTVLGSRILNQSLIRIYDYLKSIEEKDLEETLHVNYSINSSSAEKTFDLIRHLWDHFLDCVRHNTRDMFILYVKIQVLINKVDALSHFTQLGNLLANQLDRKQSYSALTCLVPTIGANDLIASNPDMVKNLLLNLSDSTFAPHASNLLEALFTIHLKEICYEKWHAFWFSNFFDNFNIKMLTHGYKSLLEKLILSSENAALPIRRLSSSPYPTDDRLCLLMMCTHIYLKIPKNKRSMDHDKVLVGSSSPAACWKKLFPYEFIVTPLRSGNQDLRLLTFNLVSESLKSTELFEIQELQLLESFIRMNFNNPDSAFRQKFINNVKKVLSRIDKGTSSIVKSSLQDDHNISSQVAIVRQQEEFLCSLFSFLSRNLCCGSNFPRRSSTLIIMELIFELLSTNRLFEHLRKTLFTHSLRDSLILCLRDSYEVNKQIALRLLKHMKDILSPLNENALLNLTNILWMLCSSPKPVNSLTASYLVKYLVHEQRFMKLVKEDSVLSEETDNVGLVTWSVLLLKLQKEISIAKISLFRAARSGPMYGTILCLRSVIADIEETGISENKQYCTRMLHETIELCLAVGDIVSEIVKNPSPEGHVPMDLNEGSSYLDKSGNQDKSTSAQLLLLCGWRSIKEICILFGLIFKKNSTKADFLSLLSYDDINSVGMFFIDQLCETKHRGAFEQAYSGFEMICERLWQCDGSTVNKLPENWLDHTMNMIQEESDNRLTVTRRSGGVPFIMQAVLSCEPVISGCKCLKRTIETLLELTNAGEQAKLELKIHALNILRALYRDSRIGEVIMPYVSEGVKLSILGYKSSSWSVRNSSSLLFAAVVNRMLGVKKTHEDLHSKNSVSAFVFFRMYPDLYDFFLQNLKMNVAEVRAGKFSPSTFPMLMLLGRLSPASSDGFSSSVSVTSFVPYVFEFCSSPVYYLRTLTSKAIIPLISPLTLVDVVKQLCFSATLEDQNCLHGILLCLSQIPKSFYETLRCSPKIWEEIQLKFYSLLWVALEMNHCFFTRAAGIELFTLLLNLPNLTPSAVSLDPLVKSCLSLLEDSCENRSPILGSDYAVRAATKFLLTQSNFENEESSKMLLDLFSLPSSLIQSVIMEYFTTDHFPEILLKKVIDRIKQTKEFGVWDKETLMAINKIVSVINEQDFRLFQNDLSLILRNIVHQMNNQNEEMLPVLIDASGTILLQELKFCTVVEEDTVVEWVELLVDYCNFDCMSEVRCAVSESVSNVLPEVLRCSQIRNKCELSLIRIMIESLLDEEKIIVDLARECSTVFLRGVKFKCESFPEGFANNNSFSAVIVLEALFLYLAHKCAGDYLTLLLEQALKEEWDEDETFEEERAFDKGDTRETRENIHLAQLVSKCLIETMNEKGLEYYCDSQIDMNVLQVHLLALNRRQPSEADHPPGIRCDATDTRHHLSEFMIVMKREIEFTLKYFDGKEEASTLSDRTFDVWVERLARRALVWKSFKTVHNVDVRLDDKLVKKFDSFLIKPIIFSDIMNWIS